MGILRKITIVLAQDTWDEIQRVMVLGKISTVRDFVTQALRFYRWYVLLRSTGEHIYIKKGKDELVAVGMPDEDDIQVLERIWNMMEDDPQPQFASNLRIVSRLSRWVSASAGFMKSFFKFSRP